MKSSHRSLLPSDRKIVDRITKIRKTADRVSRSKRRFAAYRYLRTVLRGYRHLADNELLPAMLEIAPAILTVPSACQLASAARYYRGHNVDGNRLSDAQQMDSGFAIRRRKGDRS